MKKIAVFGGTFNPVHSEHVHLAKNVIEKLGLDKLIIMPTFIPPHKKVKLASAKDRLNMLKLAFSGVNNVEISDYEIKKEGLSFTYSTLEYLKGVYPNDKLIFLMGDDMLNTFFTWKEPQKILQNAEIAVFGREGYKVDYDKLQNEFINKFGKTFTVLNIVGKEVSSTEIRVYCALKLFDVINVLPNGVLEYIKQNGVYGGGKYEEFLINNLKESRLLHTANVVVCGLKKTKEVNIESEKIYTACLLHDCAKYIDYKSVKGFILSPNVPPKVVHQFLGAFIAEKVLGVTDNEILDAIRYHTSGKANMSVLGKLVFVADMVEKGRNYNGVEILREYYEKDLDTCFIKCLKEEMVHLLNRGDYVYEETLNAYDYYVKKEN